MKTCGYAKQNADNGSSYIWNGREYLIHAAGGYELIKSKLGYIEQQTGSDNLRVRLLDLHNFVLLGDGNHSLR